jgi:hypothetical protein
MNTLTKTAAIRHARNSVVITLMGKKWAVRAFSQPRGVWTECDSADWWIARRHYSQTLVDHARTAMGLDLVQYEGGAWTSYIP